MLSWRQKSATTSERNTRIISDATKATAQGKRYIQIRDMAKQESCHICCYQAREWVALWHRVLGHRATPQSMIKALQKMPHTEDLVEQIRREIQK